ncbi:MAG: integrin alpha, partial [Acidobacteriota bacterium]|nr:integrin alpha [Acidobacteriota bacterium]
TSRAKTRKGQLRVISMTGATTLELKGNQKGDGFGSGLMFSETLDGAGDLRFSLVAGAPGRDLGDEATGEIVAFDPLDGDLQLRYPATALSLGPVRRFGHALAEVDFRTNDRRYADLWAVGAVAAAEDELVRPAVVMLDLVALGFSERLRVEGEVGSLMGWAVVGLNRDADGDGEMDVAVSAPRQSRGRKRQVGALHVLNPRTGETIFSARGKKSGDHFGYSLARFSDVDGDGIGDLLVGAPGTGKEKRPGRVFVVSGAEGRVLRTLPAEDGALHFGFAVVGIDIDGDGRKEIIVGAPADGNDRGSVFVYSDSVAPLFRLDGESSHQQFGATLGSVADLDGDGIEELLIGSLLRDPNRKRRNLWGRVEVYSPGTGATLFKISGKKASQRTGGRLPVEDGIAVNDDVRFVVGEPGEEIPYIPGPS